MRLPLETNKKKLCVDILMNPHGRSETSADSVIVQKKNTNIPNQMYHITNIININEYVLHKRA